MNTSKYIYGFPLRRTVYPVYLILILVSFTISCTKLVEVEPPATNITSDNAYNSNATAIAVITGIYTKLTSFGFSADGLPAVSICAALSADELELYSGAGDATMLQFYRNSLNNNSSKFWNSLYTTIYVTNSAIEGLSVSTGVTSNVKQQLTGEAKFMRALCFFYLVNFFGDVPLPVQTDYTVNASLIRRPSADVYEQIEKDLKDAKELMSIDFLDGTLSKYASATERVRPSRWAAAALLARVYLYQKKYALAEAEAGEVLSNTSLFELSLLSNTFLKASLGNKEAIWQIQPVNRSVNAGDAKFYIIPSGSFPGINFSHPAYLGDNVYNAFEGDDSRKTNWVSLYTDATGTYPYPSKYKVAENNAPVTEFTMVLRLAEQFLIRAEARTELNNVDGAKEDLNKIRTRAGLPDTDATTQQTLRDAILHERHVELFTEWGHRWFDLKRTGRSGSVLAPVKTNWSDNDTLYPIPASEFLKNPKLGSQNLGY